MIIEELKQVWSSVGAKAIAVALLLYHHCCSTPGELTKKVSREIHRRLRSGVS